MTGLVIFIHVVACVLIIAAILMQAGKGGGLAEGFSSAENILGSQTNTVMVKITTVLVVIFLITCLSLAFLSSSRDRSLMADLPDRKQQVTVNMDDLFNKAPSQTIVINAEGDNATVNSTDSAK